MADEDPAASAPVALATPVPEPIDLTALAQQLLGKVTLTPADVATETGIPIERLRQMWRALGFPPVPEDERFFTAADVEVLRLLASNEARGLLANDDILQVARVMGQSLARVAETEVALMTDRIGRQQLPRTLQLLESVEPFLAYVWRRHMVSALGRAFAFDAAAGEGARQLVVGFADLVGFTPLSEEVDARSLTRVVDRFEALVYENVPEHRGRVIKMIGDEVMFAVEDPIDAAEIALGLVDAHEADDSIPAIRVGLAFGDVLSWEGDLFGPTVNLASRLVQFARPSTVVIGPNMVERLAAAPGITVRQFRRRLRLKGMPRVTASLLSRAK